MKQIILLLTLIITSASQVLHAQTYPPSCVVTMPYSNAYFKANTDVEIHVYATDIGKTMNNGTVSKVEFLNGSTKLGEATTHSNNTYRFVWRCAQTGTYTLKARATNNRGVTFTSVGVIITVGTANVTQRGLSACKGKYMASLHQGQLLGNFSQVFNGVTSENACKWGSVEGTRDRTNWGGAESSYNAAMTNNMMFRYHAALWAGQFPTWMYNLSTAEAKEELVEYIKEIAVRFPRADQIDVLNEQLGNHQRDNPKLRNLFSGKTFTAVDDFGWQIWLFEQARAVFPNTKLVLNDYGLEGNTNDINEMLKLVKVLRDRGLIDGFGTQAHCFNVDGRPAGRIRQDCNQMATGGVPIYVTELDMNGGSENYSTNEQAQRSSFATHFPEFWEHPAVKGVTWWGHVVNRTWIGGTGFINENGQDRAAMTWLKSYLSGKPSVGYPICATGACVPTALEGDNTAPSEKDMLLYPNPFTSEGVQIKKGGDFVYSIYDSSGMLVEKGQGSNASVVGVGLSSGLYLLTIENEQGSSTHKILRQ